MFWHRQWGEEEKQRKQVAEPISDHDAAEADDDDTGSTKGGVLHEEGFSETKLMTRHNAQHDLEQAHSSSQHEQGLLEVLKVVDWWKVRNTSSVRYTKSWFHAVCAKCMTVASSRCAGCCLHYCFAKFARHAQQRFAWCFRIDVLQKIVTILPVQYFAHTATWQDAGVRFF